VEKSSFSFALCVRCKEKDKQDRQTAAKYHVSEKAHQSRDAIHKLEGNLPDEKQHAHTQQLAAQNEYDESTSRGSTEMPANAVRFKTERSAMTHLLNLLHQHLDPRCVHAKLAVKQSERRVG
jgi:hypothetical protein